MNNITFLSVLDDTQAQTQPCLEDSDRRNES